MICENRKRDHFFVQSHSSERNSSVSVQCWAICNSPFKGRRICIFFCIVAVMIALCSCERQRFMEEEMSDLPQIKEKGLLIVATCNNPVDYFMNEGKPMGFQYELLNEFAKHSGVNIEFLVGNSYTDNLQLLAEGYCDIIASGLISPENDFLIANIDTLYQARQVLVQRKPKNWRKMMPEELEKKMVRQPEKLKGKMVYASGSSALFDGSDFVPNRHIRFVTIRGISSEDLVELVSEGELDYAVCNWAEAQLIAHNFENIDILTELGELPVGLLVRPESIELSQGITQWLASYKKTTRYTALCQKYLSEKTFQENTLFATQTMTISKYDDIFKKYCSEIGWDWKLLAALVYQESRFIPNLRSKRGAYGLMQILPVTLKYFGTDTTASPDRHIAAGVAYIKFLDKMIAPHVDDENERIKFILASYNAGPGHVFDAQRLAKKYGKNDRVWDNNVDSCLLRKSNPKYYKDPAVRFGRCNGKETFAFVNQIMERYEYYKKNSEIP